MNIERKKDLSLYYFIKDLLLDAPSIDVQDGFPTTGLLIPSVAVEGKMIDRLEFELGNRSRLSNRMWFIDIFGINKSQRDDIGYRILDALELGIPVYDYDEGFPPDVTPTQIGALIPRRITMEIVKVIPELVTKLYWRATISLTANYTSV